MFIVMIVLNFFGVECIFWYSFCVLWIIVEAGLFNLWASFVESFFKVMSFLA